MAHVQALADRVKDTAANHLRPDGTAAQRPGRAAAAAISLIELYRALLAPFLAAHSGLTCRFEPGCSQYAHTALVQHGLWRGGWLALRRLSRCRPLGGCGYDPVPQRPSIKTGSL